MSISIGEAEAIMKAVEYYIHRTSVTPGLCRIHEVF